MADPGREATWPAELGPKWHETCRQSHVIGTPCPSGREATPCEKYPHDGCGCNLDDGTPLRSAGRKATHTDCHAEAAESYDHGFRDGLAAGREATWRDPLDWPFLLLCVLLRVSKDKTPPARETT